MSERIENRQIQYKEQIISYELHRKKVKNINLRIKPEGMVYVSAPHRVSLSYLDEFVLSKGEFILQALEYYRSHKKETVRQKIEFREEDRVRARLLFEQISREIYPYFNPLGVPYPKIKVRLMKARWGSCHYKKGTIVLNLWLIEAPRECVEYVVLHEYAHFIHPNHSKEFYALVEHFMPDWKERKRRLNEMAIG